MNQCNIEAMATHAISDERFSSHPNNGLNGNLQAYLAEISIEFQ